MTDTAGPTDTARSSAGALRIGTAPDSWGVWFPDGPRQIPWRGLLDEVQGAGYT